jgi:hypothetical protein
VVLCLPVSKSFVFSLYLHGLLAQERTLSRLLARPRVPARLIFDLDSTVLVLYGQAEGARIGYNPHYPLLCFEA